MLTIQPNFTNYRPITRPAFKGIDADRIEEEKYFYQEQVEKIDEFLDNDYVPEKIKGPFKFFRVLGNAALQGLAVFGSVLGISKAAKNGCAKVESYKFVQNAKARINNLKLGDKISALYTNIKANKNVRKLTNPVEEFFAQNAIGKKIAEFGQNTKEFLAKIIKPLKEKLTEENITKGTASVLGTGTGAAAGYEEFMKENPINPQDLDEQYEDEVEDND